MMKHWVGIACLLLGCSSSDGGEVPKPRVGSGAGACGGRDGQTYVATFTERSGTCRIGTFETVAQVPTAETLAAQADAGLACKGTTSASDDQCEISFDTDCPSRTGDGARVLERGKSKWSVDGSYATAIETLILVDPNGTHLCTSNFDVEFKRQ